MNLYTKTCFDCSKIITNNYSTSFSLGIKAFSKELQNPIYAIYGFVRFADEIVDTFHDQDKNYLIKKFRADTVEAIEQKVSLNPVLHAFQEVVNGYDIEFDLIDAFLKSMENKDGYCWRKTWNRLLFLCSMRPPRLLRNWYRSFTPVYQMPRQSI